LDGEGVTFYYDHAIQAAFGSFVITLSSGAQLIYSAYVFPNAASFSELGFGGAVFTELGPADITDEELGPADAETRPTEFQDLLSPWLLSQRSKYHVDDGETD
jgi:hypothetical protein